MFTQRFTQALYAQRQELGHDLAMYAARKNAGEDIDDVLIAETHATLARHTRALEKLYERAARVK